MKPAKLAIMALATLALVGAAQATPMYTVLWSSITPGATTPPAWPGSSTPPAALMPLSTTNATYNGVQFYSVYVWVQADSSGDRIAGLGNSGAGSMFVPLGLDNKGNPAQILQLGGPSPGNIEDAVANSDSSAWKTDFVNNDTYFTIYADSPTNGGGVPYMAGVGSPGPAGTVVYSGVRRADNFGMPGIGIVGNPSDTTCLAHIVFSGTGLHLLGTGARAVDGLQQVLDSTVLTNVPDPATLSLLVIGGAGLLLRRKRS